MRNKVLFFLPLIALLSCKNDVKQAEEAKPAEVKEKQFLVTLDLIAKKDDNMHLYYTQDKSINFEETESVWAQIKGSDNVQQVVFKLPEDVIPTDFRIDLGYGKNVEQTEIVLKKMTFNYLDKMFVASGADIFNYFYPNQENTIVDKSTGVLKRKTVDQVTAPSIYPHTTLEEELIKITR
ncbi:hypothetical protein [Flavobacterium sp.]|uniref:hypothetical protein n=1 Tax=Flavobacterium sp. TaxID=239 RepID=UPI0025FDAE03|nr:hypothetical protein [Flavobacterium sp.]